MSDNAPISKPASLKPPPVLLLAALLFWGQHSDFVTFGAVAGVILESSRLIRFRMDLTEDDFRRLWNFCTLLTLALALYAFSNDEDIGGLSGLIHSSGAAGRHNASLATLNTATVLLRWFPMTLFLFIAAQLFSERGAVPLSAISSVFRRRRRRDAAGTPERNIDVTYPYFIVCLFSAGIHANNPEGTQYFFWEQCVLVAWALWPLRSRRFGLPAWLGLFLVVAAIGFAGQYSIMQAGRALENMNAEWIARWVRQRTDAEQSMTAIGQIGRLKLSSSIVIRLHADSGRMPPPYLREATYRDYHPQKQVWYVGGITASKGGTRSEFDEVGHDLHEPNSDNWLLLWGKTNTSTVNIACYLDGRAADNSGNCEGLLPLPSGTCRLENLPAISVKKNMTGAVMASEAGSLVIFDARYGPGETIDSPPDKALDFLVPTNEVAALDQVIGEMNLAGLTDSQKLQKIQGFFAQNFTYSTWQKQDKRPTTNETALTKFLLHSRSGHCEYFATATVLLLRELHIPARYAVGYAVHEPKGSGYVVRERDAHAWCLVWNSKAGNWMDFDTTPASWVEAEGANSANWFSDFWSWVGFEIAKAKLRFSQEDLRHYLLWVLIPLMILLLLQIVFRRRRQRRTGPDRKSSEKFFWPGLDSEFYELEQRLTERGVPRQAGEPLSGWLERMVVEPALTDLRGPLQRLLQLHYRYRFDPRGLNTEEREQLRREARACLDTLLQTKAASR